MILNRFNIKLIQKLFGLSQTGVYDESTKAAVKNWNLRCQKGPVEVLDKPTYDDIVLKLSHTVDNLEIEMDEDMENENDLNATTDISETDASYSIKYLNSDQYVTSHGKILDKRYIFFHHTAGWNDPYKTVDDWNSDTRGRIGTAFVIGGINIANHDSRFNGQIVKCIPDEYFAWHLGSTSADKINLQMHIHSIGIEICNFGYLTERNGRFFTWTGRQVADKYVEDLGFSFRGYRYWHKYTEEQIDSLYVLTKHLSRKWNIDTNVGLKDWINKSKNPADAFNFSEPARDGKVRGILSHTNVRLPNQKTDVSPQKLLIEMIKSL
jgi:N-acetyl-anhydromuramyl-L-alanine amidase AmpD